MNFTDLPLAEQRRVIALSPVCNRVNSAPVSWKRKADLYGRFGRWALVAPRYLPLP